MTFCSISYYFILVTDIHSTSSTDGHTHRLVLIVGDMYQNVYFWNTKIVFHIPLFPHPMHETFWLWNYFEHHNPTSLSLINVHITNFHFYDTSAICHKVEIFIIEASKDPGRDLYSISVFFFRSKSSENLYVIYTCSIITSAQGAHLTDFSIKYLYLDLHF